MAATDNFSGAWSFDRFWRSKRLPRMATALPVFLVVVAIFLGTFTYMTLTGLSPFAPSKGVVTALLLANFAIVLVLAGLIGWRVIRLIMA